MIPVSRIRRLCTQAPAFFLLGLLYAGCSEEDGASEDPLSTIPVPQNVSASNGVYTDRVVLRWDSTAQAAAFTVYRADSLTGAFGVIADSLGDTQFVDTTAVAGHYYYYSVATVTIQGSRGNPSAYAVGQADFRPAVLNPPSLSISDETALSAAPLIRISAVSGARHYRLYRSSYATGSYTLIRDSITTDSVRDGSMARGVRYFYRALTVDSLGAQSALGEPTPCAWYAFDSSRTVAGLSASDGTVAAAVEILWDVSADTCQYQVFRADSPDGPFVPLIQTSTSPAMDSSAVAGTVYYYSVASKASVDTAFGPQCPGDAGFALALSSLPAPTGVQASDGAFDDTITVSWTTVSGAAAYAIERSTNPDGPYAAVRTSHADTVFIDGSVAVNQVYFYRVRALNGQAVAGAPSVCDSGYALYAYVPSFVRASEGTVGEVRVTWQNTYAHHYRVYRSYRNLPDTIIVDSCAVPSLTDSSVAPGPYRYRVVAVYPGGVTSLPSAYDFGFRAVTNSEFFVQFHNTTVATAHAKLTLLAQETLGEETRAGDVSGTVKYVAGVDFGYANVVITYSNYCDNYLTANGKYVTRVGWISRDGELTDRLTVTGIYSGTVEYHLTIDDEKASGGHYTVTQSGGQAEQVQFSSVKDELIL